MKQKKIKDTETTTPRKRQFRPKKKNLQASLLVEPPQEISVPVYEVPHTDTTEPVKVLSFSKLIANDDILSALEKASYQVPSDLLFKIMPATLRGSDTLILKPKQSDGFLIGVVPAISKILYADNQDEKETKPIALFLFPSDESAQSAYKLTTDVFQNFKIKFSLVTQESFDVGEVIFGTPKSLAIFIKNEKVKLNTFKLVTVHELHAFEGEDKEILSTILAQLSENNSQKIFISYQNTPQIREVAFKYLEDPEIFAFLPCAVTDQYPRQFAHALEATKKFQVLLGYLRTYRPRAALVVANTRTVAEWIAFKLHGNGIKISLMTMPVSPYNNRVKLLDSVAKSEINVFVATDDAIKNFGIENLHCIYHFDLPDNPQRFLDRLNKLIGVRNPISIAFVCEDYGFNMGKIEDALGFKIRVTTPDKNFYHFKDTSEYPLESSGRVKSIEQPAQAQSIKAEPLESPEKFEEKSDHKPEKTVEKSAQRAEKHLDKQDKAVTTQDDVRTNARVPRSQQRTQHQPDTSKFVRRDDRAREAVADAVLAARMAEEKRQAQNHNAHSHEHRSQRTESASTTKNTSALPTLLSVFSDALRAGYDATKASLLHNTEHKFPALHRFLKRKEKK